MTYADIYRSWQDNPHGFWMERAAAIEWIEPPRAALDESQAPFYHWFPGGRLNTCHNALDRHVEGGRGDQAALIYDSPMTGIKRGYTYRELRDRTAELAGALRRQGVEKGDRVIVYMPMVPEAVVTMLACARIGAVHSVVFGGFAAQELAARIDDCEPKLIMAASCGLEPGRVVEYKPLLDRAIELSGHSPRCVILQRPELQASLVEGRDIDWDDALDGAEPAECVALEAADPLYILYTSGTTGHPKGIVRDNGGHAVAVTWSVRAVYDAGPGDVYWAASDIGWAVGHTYTVYAPLLAGCTTILYEGKPVGTPDAGAFWRVCEEHGVNVIFMAPTAMRGISGRTHRSAGGRLRPLQAARGVPGRRALRPRHAGVGERCCSGPPSTTGGRPRPAGRSPPTAWGWSCSRSRPGRPGSRCPATTCACWTRPVNGWQPA